MADTAKAFHVVFLIFDEITQLDFSGPAQVLCRIPGAVVHTAAKAVKPIATDSGYSILPSTSFADCPQADLLCVPGGFGTRDVIQDDQTLQFLRDQAKGLSAGEKSLYTKARNVLVSELAFALDVEEDLAMAKVDGALV